MMIALAPAASGLQTIPNESELLGLLDALRKLERSFKLGHRFNLFEALNISRQEIRHSRFLAYLLDPNETHGLGDKFLRAILLVVAEDHPTLPVNRLTLSIRDLGDASVHCERDHFDISVQIPSLQLLFVIENKVGASESSGQLETYRRRVQMRYPGYRFMGCFLTPDGYEGEDDHWGTLDYGTVAAEIQRVARESTLPTEVAISLQHYTELIERKIVTSQALIDACREIYRSHKVAFDLVVEHGQESLLASAFDQFAIEHSGLEATARRSWTLFFQHPNWRSMTHALRADRRRWTSTFPVLYWFRLEEKRLHLKLEIGPLSADVAPERATLVQAFKSKYDSSRGRSSDTFTRILSKSVPVPEDPDMEDVLAAMNKLWQLFISAECGPDEVERLVRDWADPLKPAAMDEFAQ